LENKAAADSRGINVPLRPAIERFREHYGCPAARTIVAISALWALAGCAATPGNETTASTAPAATSANKLSDVFATPDWAKFSTGERVKTAARAVTPDDLIGADGSCAATRIAAPEPAPQQTSETDGATNNAAVSMVPVQPGPTVAGGIALAMTECDVAQRAGYPGNVEIGSEAGGERSAVLTYRQGPWPGIYRFRGGRLVSIERVEVIEPPKPKKIAKPAKPPAKVNLRSSTAQ
jgi:hypothetical protein